MMKRISSSSSSKPISASSPGRTVDKFPPPAPLMRFLRSNVGSRSGGRARSRASPIFVSKKSLNLRHLTTKTTAAEAAQEPSSPKVTCMGQVRVRRSSSKQSTTRRRRKNPVPAVNRCRWVPNPGFCCREIKLNSLRLRPHFENWPVFLRIRRNQDESFKSKKGPVSVSVSVREENGSSFNTNYYAEKEDEDNQLRTNPDPSSSAPPKNALLLTRCRSAPYRSSSLACRFWGSPLSNTTAEAEETAEQKNTHDDDQADEENNGSELEDSNSSIDDHNHPVECGTVKPGEEVVASQDRPMINVMLTRCKSEPARTGNKLLDPEPEGIFWRQTEFGDVNGLISESKSAQVCD